MHLVASVRLCVCVFGCTQGTLYTTTTVYYQSKVFACVSVIRGRIWIIAHMRSIGILYNSTGALYRIWEIPLFSTLSAKNFGNSAISGHSAYSSNSAFSAIPPFSGNSAFTGKGGITGKRWNYRKYQKRRNYRNDWKRWIHRKRRNYWNLAELGGISQILYMYDKHIKVTLYSRSWVLFPGL